MRQIKLRVKNRIAKPLAIIALTLGMQTGQASGLPTIDFAALATAMQEFVETATHYKKQVDEWKQKYIVDTKAFSIAGDLMSIYSSVSEITALAKEVQDTFKKYEEGGIEGLAKDYFDELKMDLYKNRSQSVQNQCTTVRALEKEILKLQETHATKTTKSNEALGKMVDLVKSEKTSSVEIGSVNLGREKAKDKIAAEAAEYDRVLKYFKDKLDVARGNCDNAQKEEIITAARKAAFPVEGVGLGFSNPSNASGSGQQESMF